MVCRGGEGVAREWLRERPEVVWIVESGVKFVIVFTIRALPGSRRRSLPGRRLGLTSF